MTTPEARRDRTKAPQVQDSDKDTPPGPPDEARMSEVAKRLLSTPPDRQSVGKAVAPKRLGPGT